MNGNKEQSGKQPAGHALNPLRWVRWKVLVALVALVGVFYSLGLDPLSRRTLNDLGDSGEHGARWNIGGLDLGLLTGDFDFSDVLVSTPRTQGRTTQKNRTFSAETVHVDFNMQQALRRRLHGSVHLQAPRLVVKRRRNGSLNVGEIGDSGGGEAPGDAAPQDAPTDWVAAIENWVKKLREWEKKRREWAGGHDGETGKPPGSPHGKPGREDGSREPDLSRRVTYPFEGVTRFVAEVVEASGLEIHFEDEAPGESGGESTAIPPLTDGTLTIRNLSEKPAVHPEPITWTISGKLGEATLEVAGSLHLQRGQGDGPEHLIRFTAGGRGLPLALANAFARDSLPMVFESGTVDLEVAFRLEDLEHIDIQPSLQLKSVIARPRRGVGRIAGIDAARFCELLTGASRELDPLVIDDLRVTGTLARPIIELGDTIRHLVESGVTSFVRGQIDRGVSRGTEELEKILREGTSKDSDSVVPTAAGELRKVLEGLIPGSRK